MPDLSYAPCNWWIAGINSTAIVHSVHRIDQSIQRKPTNREISGARIVENIQQNTTSLWEKQKHYANKHARSALLMAISHNIHMWESNHHCTPGAITKKATMLRSYWVQTGKYQCRWTLSLSLQHKRNENGSTAISSMHPKLHTRPAGVKQKSTSSAESCIPESINADCHAARTYDKACHNTRSIKTGCNMSSHTDILISLPGAQTPQTTKYCNLQSCKHHLVIE